MKGNNRESPNFLKLPKLDYNKFTFRSCFKSPQKANFKIDDIFLEKVNDFADNFSNPMAKTLKFGYSPYNKKPEEVISPNLNNNQGAVLSNLNDYHIEENYNVDDKRLFKFIARRKPDYNLINHTKTNYSPLEVIFNKWPRFHEKYFYF